MRNQEQTNEFSGFFRVEFASCRVARFDNVFQPPAAGVKCRLKQAFDGDITVDDVDGAVAARDVLLLNKAADGMAFGALKPAQPQDVDVGDAAVEQVLFGGEDLAGGLGLRIGCGGFVAFARLYRRKRWCCL